MTVSLASWPRLLDARGPRTTDGLEPSWGTSGRCSSLEVTGRRNHNTACWGRICKRAPMLEQHRPASFLLRSGISRCHDASGVIRMRAIQTSQPVTPGARLQYRSMAMLAAAAMRCLQQDSGGRERAVIGNRDVGRGHRSPRDHARSAPQALHNVMTSAQDMHAARTYWLWTSSVASILEGAAQLQPHQACHPRCRLICTHGGLRKRLVCVVLHTPLPCRSGLQTSTA